jgi:hypothetical protein
VVQLVEDDAQGAPAAALEHFAELARVLDDATAKAIKLEDTGMVEGLTRAKVAATRGTGLLPSFAMPWFPATTTTSRHRPLAAKSLSRPSSAGSCRPSPV